jgi:hypothetical protein
MGLHLYCIVPAGHAPPAGAQGVAGAAVEPIAVTAALDAWMSRHAERTAALLETIREHNAVVQLAMTETVTPVPIRFGQWLADDQDATVRAAAQAERWQELLGRLAGHAEFGVAIQVAEPAAREQEEGPGKEQDVRGRPAQSGTAHMRALAQRQAVTAARRDVAERLVAEVDRRVGGLAAARRSDLQRAGEGTARIAFLVAWSEVQNYHSAVRSVSAQDGSRYLFTGPWPPYSFVE